MACLNQISGSCDVAKICQSPLNNLVGRKYDNKISKFQEKMDVHFLEHVPSKQLAQIDFCQKQLMRYRDLSRMRVRYAERNDRICKKSKDPIKNESVAKVVLKRDLYLHSYSRVPNTVLFSWCDSYGILDDMVSNRAHGRECYRRVCRGIYINGRFINSQLVALGTRYGFIDIRSADHPMENTQTEHYRGFVVKYNTKEYFTEESSSCEPFQELTAQMYSDSDEEDKSEEEETLVLKLDADDTSELHDMENIGLIDFGVNPHGNCYVCNTHYPDIMFVECFDVTDNRPLNFEVSLCDFCPWPFKSFKCSKNFINHCPSLRYVELVGQSNEKEAQGFVDTMKGFFSSIYGSITDLPTKLTEFRAALGEVKSLGDGITKVKEGISKYQHIIDFAIALGVCTYQVYQYGWETAYPLIGYALYSQKELIATFGSYIKDLAYSFISFFSGKSNDKSMLEGQGKLDNIGLFASIGGFVSLVAVFLTGKNCNLEGVLDISKKVSNYFFEIGHKGITAISTVGDYLQHGLETALAYCGCFLPTERGDLRKRYEKHLIFFKTKSSNTPYWLDAYVENEKLNELHTELQELMLTEQSALRLGMKVLERGIVNFKNFLMTVKRNLEEAGSSNLPTRPEPVCVQFQGCGGVGKTTLCNLIADILAIKYGGAKEDEIKRGINRGEYVYTWMHSKGDDKDTYWNGYQKQTVVMWEEAAQSTDTDSNPSPDPALLMQLVNTAPYMTKQAFSGKGKIPYTSPFLLISTNREGLWSVHDANFKSNWPIHRRLHMTYRVARKPEHKDLSYLEFDALLKNFKGGADCPCTFEEVIYYPYDSHQDAHGVTYQKTKFRFGNFITFDELLLRIKAKHLEQETKFKAIAAREYDSFLNLLAQGKMSNIVTIDGTALPEYKFTDKKASFIVPMDKLDEYYALYQALRGVDIAFHDRFDKHFVKCKTSKGELLCYTEDGNYYHWREDLVSKFLECADKKTGDMFYEHMYAQMQSLLATIGHWYKSVSGDAGGLTHNVAAMYLVHVMSMENHIPFSIPLLTNYDFLQRVSVAIVPTGMETMNYDYGSTYDKVIAETSPYVDRFDDSWWPYIKAAMGCVATLAGCLGVYGAYKMFKEPSKTIDSVQIFVQDSVNGAKQRIIDIANWVTGIFADIKAKIKGYVLRAAESVKTLGGNARDLLHGIYTRIRSYVVSEANKEGLVLTVTTEEGNALVAQAAQEVDATDEQKGLFIANLCLEMFKNRLVAQSHNSENVPMIAKKAVVRPRSLAGQGEDTFSLRDADADGIVAKVIRNTVAFYSYDGESWLKRTNALFVHSRTCLMPRHCYESLCKATKLRFYSTGTMAMWEGDMSHFIVKDAKYSDGVKYADLVSLTLKRSHVAFKDITNHFMKAEEMGKFTSIPVILSTIVEYTQVNNGKNELKLFFRAYVGQHARAVDEQVYVTGKERIVCRKGYLYDIPTQASDCGGGLVARNPCVQKKILGIHAAGDKITTGFAIAISYEDLMNMIPKYGELEAQGANPQLVVHMCEENGEVVNNTHGLAVFSKEEISENCAAFDINTTSEFAGSCSIVGMSRYPKSTMTNRIIKSPISDDLPWAPNKEPATTYKFVEEDGKRVNVLGRCFQKSHAPFKRLDQETLDNCAEDAFSCLYGEGYKDHARILTIEEAVFGVEGDPFLNSVKMNASPGVIYKTKLRGGSGKHQWINLQTKWISPELRRDVENKLLEWAMGIRQFDAFSCERKSELRMPEKKNKPRMYNASDLVTTICHKMLFGAFVSWSNKNWAKSGVTVGINPYEDFGYLSELLTQKGPHVIAGDFTTFDGTLPQMLLEAVMRQIILWYKSAGIDDKYIRMMYTGDHVIRFYHTIIEGLYVEMHKGNPSGNLLTTHLNSYSLKTSFRYVWVQLVVKFEDFHGRISDHVDSTLSSYNKNCFDVANGDDNCNNINKGALEVYNQNTITEEFLNSFGMIYTDETKSENTLPYRTIDQITYLKRSFCGEKYGRLDPVSIQEIPHWCKRGESTWDNFECSLRSCIMEAYLHGEDYFNYIRNGILSALQGTKFSCIRIMCYQEAHRLFMVHGGECFPSFLP